MFKATLLVSVRLLHAIVNKKGALVVVMDTSQPINKQMFVIDAITESFVCRVSCIRYDR